MMKRMVLALASLCLVLSLARAQAQSMAAEDIAAEAAKCQTCHGPLESAPRLNGQRADYILTRLREFHNPASQSPHATYAMWDTATGLGTKKAQALADYFSRQAPTPAHGGALAGKGEKLYQSGGGQIPACASCHGAQGEGQGASPRLAGQRDLYLSQELANFGMTTRFHETMNAPARSLNDDQIKSLVSYLGGD